MLVTDPQPIPYSNSAKVLVFLYMLDEPDGPMFTAVGFANASEAVCYFRDEWGVEESVWHGIPDQLAGCLDDWIAPVRVFQAADGSREHHRWQRMADGVWVEFAGPTGGYSHQIA